MEVIFNNIILLPKLDNKHSCVTVLFDAGANLEIDGKNGVAHLLEHVLTAQADFGVTFEAETQLEYMLFQVTQAPDNTAENLKKIKELVFDEPLKEDAFFTQQKRLTFELETSYQHQMFQRAYGELFGKDSGQYRGWSGTKDSIEALLFSDVCNHRQQLFSKSKLIVISGNFNEGEVLKATSNLSSKKMLDPSPVQVSLKNKIVCSKLANEHVSSLDVFIPTASIEKFKDRALDTVLQQSLIGGNRAVLDNLLYKETGTVYSIETELLHWLNGGVFAFGFQVGNEYFEQVFESVQKILINLPDVLTQDIVDIARERSIIQFNEMMGRPDLLSRWVGENLLLAQSNITPSEYEEILKNCTYKDIKLKAETISKMPYVYI